MPSAVAADPATAFQPDAYPDDRWPRLDPYEPLDWGPLTVRSHAALFHQRLSFTPGRFSPLPPGQVEVLASFSHANLWGQMPSYFLDGEWSRIGVRGAFGLARGIEIGAEFTATGRHGGFLDNFIMQFHDLLGITQARRDLFPKDRLRFETITAGGGSILWLDDSKAGFGMANPVIFGKVALMQQRRGRPGITLDIALKLPLGRVADGFATNGWDVCLGLPLQLPIADGFQIFLAPAVIFAPGDTVFGISLVEWQKSLLLGVEIRAATNFTVVFHYLYQDGIAKDRTFEPLWKSTHEFVLGAKWAPDGTGQSLLEFGLIENSIHDANTPDFGFHVALRLRFR